jgi:predicted metal-dependent phosphoesterase TrpH
MQVISPQQARDLLKDGWKAADLHVHTNKSFDVLPHASLSPAALYEKAKAKGMSFVTFTDHDTIEGHKEVQKQDLVVGVEIKVLDKRIGHTVHINVYEVDDTQYGILNFLARQGDLATFISFCRSENIPHTLNHPYWCEMGQKIKKNIVEELIQMFPVVELNMARPRADNDKVMELAEKYNKGVVAATDTHTGGIGEAYTVAQGETFREFWNNIVARKSYVVRKDMSMQFITTEVNTRIKQAFSSEISNAQLSEFAKQASRGSVRVAVNSLVFTRKIKPIGFILKHTLLGVSHSRVPAALYLTQSSIRK